MIFSSDIFFNMLCKPLQYLVNCVTYAPMSVCLYTVSMAYGPTLEATETIKNILVSPKDKAPMEKKNGAI